MSLLDRLRRLERRRDDGGWLILNPREGPIVIEHNEHGEAVFAGGVQRLPDEGEAEFLARVGYRPGAASVWLPVNGRDRRIVL